MSQYLCMNDDIRASSNQAGICALTEHDFGFSISSFDLGYRLLRLNMNKSQVGIPIHRNLRVSSENQTV